MPFESQKAQSDSKVYVRRNGVSACGDVDGNSSLGSNDEWRDQNSCL